MTLHYEDAGLRLFHGSNKDVLPTFEDASFDSIVTDPPYELSNDGKASPGRVLVEFMFPEQPKVVAESARHDELPFLVSQVLGLGAGGGVPTPAATVPVSAVALDDHSTVRDDDVENREVRPIGISDNHALVDDETEAPEYLGCFQFELADPAQLLQILGEVGCGFQSGGLGVGLRVSSPGLPGLLASCAAVVGGREDVGLGDDAYARLVRAFSTAGESAVFSLRDLSGAAGEELSADGAFVLLSLSLFAGAQLVRTGPGARGLSAKAQPCRIRVVDDTTNRALSFDLLIHPTSVSSVGFMGKEWDGSKIAYDVDLWRECLRVLKPGGFLLAFGGTRTWHRIAVAIEDAGFEIRDSIAWLYGCLSDDTEILTSEGWVRYDRATEGQHALAFDTATGALAWQAIQHVHRYPYAGEMVRLHSEHTDQLLTPNHRVVLDEGRPTPHTPYVPSEQDLRRLLADVPGARPLPVGAEADVLAGVRGSADLAAEEGQGQASLGAGRPYGAVRDVRDGDVEAGRLAQEDLGGVLLEPMQRRAPGGGVGEALPQGQGGLDRRQPGVLSREDDRAEQPRMEGRRYRVQEARELRRSALRASAGMGATDGPQGRVHHGAPATDGRPLRVPADQAGSHQPREPRPQGQPTGEPDPLALEPSAQALRVGEDGGGRLLPSTGVTADVVDYAGVVWCITVPHGAFIARRNGLIFATGNSGFPKSMDVSKAIDKAAGAQREVVGRAKGAGSDRTASLGSFASEYDETMPATDAARQWEGWGTALKPAFEPIVVARKPLAGTVAANVLAYGTGAINIDACRVPGAVPQVVQGGRKINGGRYNDSGDGEIRRELSDPHAAGRFPSNVLLDQSQAAELDRQAPDTGGAGKASGPTLTGASTSVARGKFNGVNDSPFYGDRGGASRFFPTFRYEAKAPGSERPTVDGVAHATVKPLDLMRWLVRLVTRPGGRVLDLFAGSGTTGEAALLEGMEVDLIELEADHLPLILQRVRKPLQPSMFGDWEDGAA